MPQNRTIDIKRTESSPTEPVTLPEVKAHLIVTSTDDDTLLTALITSCRKAIEQYTNLSIVAKTIIFIADLYKEWELPYGPVVAITGVQTRTGTEGSGPQSYTTLTSGWNQSGEDFISFIPVNNTPGYDSTYAWWPDLPFSQNQLNNRYRITYTAGYGTVPEPLKLAILNEIAYRYENRGEATNITGICETARILAEPFERKLWF